MADWSLWICRDENASPRIGTRICVIGDVQNGFKHNTSSGYDPDADDRSKQLFKLGSVNEALLTPGTQACDGTDGCIERHEAEERPGTLACDGTDGCIERQLNELQKLALSIAAPPQGFKASLWKEVQQLLHNRKLTELTWR
jgi:hypothetical protein